MIDLIASTPIARISVLIAIFAVVVLLSMFGLSQVERRLIMRGELREIAGHDHAGVSQGTLHQRSEGIWAKLIERIEQSGFSLADTKGDALRERLKAAGFQSPIAPRLYTLLRLGLVIVLPSLYVLTSIGSGADITILRLYLIGSACALVGLYLPALIVRARADRRREAITNGFPDCLDLMLICVEAGLGLEAALDRVAREMAIAQPLVVELLATATLRLRAGATREEALRKMAEDSGVDEIRSFATLLIQSDRLGTSIGTTLRIYASEMRERRRMRAEERAHRLPVLLSIPLVVCMLPTMIGVLMLPAIIRVVRQLLPALAGG